MRLLADLRKFWRSLSKAGQVFIVSAFILGLGSAAGLPGWGRGIAGLVALVSGLILLYQTVRYAARQSIWSLRNRLLVVYLFIALVPVLLLTTLAVAALWAMSGQIAVYLATSEFDRRINFLRGAADNLLDNDSEEARVTGFYRLADFLSDHYPGIEVVAAAPDTWHFPKDSKLELPDRQWESTSGMVIKDHRLYAWMNIRNEKSERVSVLVPLTDDFLASLVPGLGEISVVPIEDLDRKDRARMMLRKSTRSSLVRVPDALNRFDLEVLWGSVVHVAEWENPGKTEPAFFAVRSRISAIGSVIFSQKTAWENSSALIVVSVLAVVFLVMEVIALLIGITMSRKITSAVHELYEGTERVMEGDFSHRIHLQGKDQLATLGTSFNRMTENVERLLQVAKEKERYEAELMIAKEVQAQLYPSSVPESALLDLTALYRPARMVSGDYFDYRRVSGSKVALAIGDVAGKGISAAILMATIQSAFRVRMYEALKDRNVVTADLVTHLNRYLHANTPPEKFATFLLAIFDEQESTLTYTNAGHLQPILIRQGKAQRLEVDGMVIGAFPFAQYGTSSLLMKPGDLLVCFTDGISEPENEYGEMYGEERLVDLICKNAHLTDTQLVNLIIESVERWTGKPELQDDMTLLVARCKGTNS